MASRSKYLLTGGVEVKGTIGPKYPKDLQVKANAACSKTFKGFLKKGAKSKVVAALGPKSDFPEGYPFAECFLVQADWNGKSTF